MGEGVISVCLASYNGAPWIAEQIGSILPQLGSDDQLIVSDDRSSDDTIAIVQGLDDPRIVVLPHEDNVGYSRNFERALRAARGDVIFLADQDDVWRPGKVEACCRALETCDFVVTDARVVDGDLNVLEPSHMTLNGTAPGLRRNWLATRYIGACMAFRRSVLDVALPFPARADLAPHDYWICLVAERWFRVRLIRRPYLDYRRHGGNASNGGVGKGRGLLTKVAARAYVAAHLTLRRGPR